jgi:hypothetical protein
MAVKYMFITLMLIIIASMLTSAATSLQQAGSVI